MGVTTTTVTETIASESINQIVIPEPLTPAVWEAITWVVPDATGHIHRWVSEDPGTITGSKAENADFTDHDYTTGKAEGTPATVGDLAKYADEVTAAGSSQTKEQIAARIDRRIRKRIDKDVLALAPGCTNHSDYTGLALDTDKFIDSMSLFGAQNPTNQRICFVGSAGQVAALTKAIVNNGGGFGGGAYGEALVNASRTQGFVAPILGAEVYRGDVYIDGADAVGMFVSVPEFGSMINNQWQAGSGLGAAFWWTPRVEMQRQAKSTSYDIVDSTRYTVAIVSQINVRKLTALK